MREGVSTTQTKYRWRRFPSQLSLVKWQVQTSVIDSESTLYLLKLVQIRFRYLAIGGQHRQVMGKNRCVVPVETAFDDCRVVDDAVLGMDRRIGYRVIRLPVN